MPMIKLFWWRLDGSEHGNFGDEISRLLIKKLFYKDSVWAPADKCEMIGAGSILAEVYETKGKNKPYVWSSGFIEDRKLRVSTNDFKFCSVRGKLTLSRIDGSGKEKIALGDAGLLASHLLPAKSRLLGHKKYRIGILPHYKEANSEFIRVMRHRGNEVFIIDATWPCEKVVESIAQCQALISSSLHGLIVADSVGTPNVHLSMAGLVEGGQYKFRDYYSVFLEERYDPIELTDVYSRSNGQLYQLVMDHYKIPDDLAEIKSNIIAAFPLK